MGKSPEIGGSLLHVWGNNNKNRREELINGSWSVQWWIRSRKMGVNDLHKMYFFDVYFINNTIDYSQLTKSTVKSNLNHASTI